MLTEPRATRLSAVLLYVILSIMLIFAAIFIAWPLLTTEYPTHSDVFWTGVQCGVLGILSLGFFAIGLFLLFRLTVRLLKPKR